MAEMVASNGNGYHGDAPHVTAGSMWRSAREQGYLKQLPSGNYARLRPVALDKLLLGGEIPDILTPLVVKMLMDGADRVGLDEFLSEKGTENALSQFAEMISLVNLICIAAFVEPKIVTSPQAEDEISIDDLDMADRGLVFNLALQPVEVLRRFRLESRPDVETVPDGEQVGPKTKRAARRKRPMGSAATG